MSRLQQIELNFFSSLASKTRAVLADASKTQEEKIAELAHLALRYKPKQRRAKVSRGQQSRSRALHFRSIRLRAHCYLLATMKWIQPKRISASEKHPTRGRVESITVKPSRPEEGKEYPFMEFSA